MGGLADFNDLMVSKGGAALAEIMDTMIAESEAEESGATRSTASSRKTAHRAMLERFDLDQLIGMQEKMRKTVDVMTAHQINLDDPGLLTPEEAEELMAELLDQTDIKELLEVRREMIRAAVFASISAEHRQAGDENPDRTNGFIPVPALGKKFCREGAGRLAPMLDEEKFKKALGDRWEQAYQVDVVPEQVVPEHVSYTLDSERILSLAERDPGILEILRECLVPGEYRTPRFTIRDL
jgi:hypothetical protein